MRSTVSSAAAIVALFMSIPALATYGSTTCNANNEPDWGDCDTIANGYEGSVDYIQPFNGGCTALNPPSGVDPDTLNCVISVCFNNGNVNASLDAVYTDYVTVRAVCDTDANIPSGGQYEDPDYDVTVVVDLNTYYNPPSKRDVPAAPQTKRTHAKSLGRRDGTCTDGTGDYKLLATFENTEKPGTEKAVTGRLPNGSSYTIQKSDAQTIGVETSVSVEAGFFDLFDASASVSVQASDTVTTTTGVTVNVDCDDGQEGIIYVYPVYTEYAGECTSDNNNEIDVYSPASTQNNYRVTCLGTGS